MAPTQAYFTWDAAGRPWRPALPVREWVALFAAHGVRWLGTLGSDDVRHLQSSNPQDHTPFPVNPWPIALPPLPRGYVVCACDHADGPWSDQLLADARAGKTPWLKYLNFRGHHYDVRTGWEATASDDEHLHVSVRSDWIDRSIGIYSPFKGDNVITTDDIKALLGYSVTGVSPFTKQSASFPLKDWITGGNAATYHLVEQLATLSAELAARDAADATRDAGTTTAIEALSEALRAGRGDISTTAILERIDQRAAESADRERAQAAELATVRAKLADADRERDELRERLAAALELNPTDTPAPATG